MKLAVLGKRSEIAGEVIAGSGSSLIGRAACELREDGLRDEKRHFV